MPEEKVYKGKKLRHAGVPENFLKYFSEASILLGTFTENIQAISELHSCI